MVYDIKPITSAKELDCGPTCLAMLLDFYGKYDGDLDALAKECKLLIDGCTAGDLMRVGKAHGLDMRAYKQDAESLVAMDRPGIIWWRYGHFCVFCGVDDDGFVHIINPDMGHYRMSYGMLQSFYSGVTLCNGELEETTEQA